MDPARKSTDSSESDNIRKVAVEINNQSHLEKLDLNLELENLLKEICSKHQLIYEPEKFSFTFKSSFERNLQTAYITEENKFEIKSGEILKLAKSPKRTVASFAKNLFDEYDDYTRDIYTSNMRLDTLVKISRISNDVTILKLLQDYNILNEIINFVEKKNLDMASWNCCYQILEHALIKGFLESLPNLVVNRIVKLISSDAVIPNDVILLSLRILVFLASKKNFRCPVGFLNDLLPHIRKVDQPEIQENAIRLANYLFIYPNNEREQKMVYDFLINSETIRTVSGFVLRRNLNKGMKHELYVYQTIILRKYTKRLRTLITENEDILEKIRKASAHDFSKGKNEFEVEEDRALKRAFSKSLQSLTDAFGQVRTSFRRRRTFSTDSQSSVTSQEEGKHGEFRNRSASVDRDKRKKRPTFTTYLSEINMEFDSMNNNYSNLDFTTNVFQDKPLSFQFYGDFNKDAVNWQSNKKYQRFCSMPALGKSEVDGKSKLLLEPGKQEKPTPSPKMGKKSKMKAQVGKKRVSELTLNNIFYFARKYKSAFTKLLVISEDGARPILYLADNITRLLCDLFQVGNRFRIDENSESFQPLCFHYFERFLEELFCISMTLFDKTRREMKVKVDSSDYFVVLDVVKQQLIQALSSKPNEFEELQKNLEGIPYEVVVKKREAAITHQIKKDLTSKPGFMQLRDVLKPEIVALISKQRRLFMETGEHVPKIHSLGLKVQKTHEKGQFIRFNKVENVIEFQNCDGSHPQCQHKTEKKVEISDIDEVQIREKSHLGKIVVNSVLSERDMFGRQGGKQYIKSSEDILNEHEIFPVSLKKSDQTYADFCSSKKLYMDYWYDGINLLLKKPMTSSTMAHDLEDLLELEMTSRYLEVEGLDIPDNAPEIPPPPYNYDFCTE